MMCSVEVLLGEWVWEIEETEKSLSGWRMKEKRGKMGRGKAEDDGYGQPL